MASTALPKPAASFSSQPLTLRSPSGASAGGDFHSRKVQIKLQPTLMAEHYFKVMLNALKNVEDAECNYH